MSGAETGETLDTLEMATAVLTRNFELLRRRTDVYADLDKSEYLLLRTLEEIGDADITTLAGAVGLDPSTAGRQVSVMLGRGLVTKVADGTDRRRSIISPSPRGRELMNVTRGRRRQITEELLAGWTPDELDTFARLLTTYNQAVAAKYLLTDGG